MLSFGGQVLPSSFDPEQANAATMGAAAIGTLKAAASGAGTPPDPKLVAPDEQVSAYAGWRAIKGLQQANAVANGNSDAAAASDDDDEEDATQEADEEAGVEAKKEMVEEEEGKTKSDDGVYSDSDEQAAIDEAEQASASAEESKPEESMADAEDAENAEDQARANANPLSLASKGTRARPVGDVLARAAMQVRQETSRLRTRTKGAPPLVSMIVCKKTKEKLKAMSCKLVLEISGVPEGCECRFKAKQCPAVPGDLGFTGVSPSLAFSPPQLAGTTVILCMYWQWLKPPDRSKEEAQVAEDTKNFAVDLVKAAHFHAEGGAKAVATVYYAMTPPPLLMPTTFAIPATPAPLYMKEEYGTTHVPLPTAPATTPSPFMFTTPSPFAGAFGGGGAKPGAPAARPGAPAGRGGGGGSGSPWRRRRRPRSPAGPGCGGSGTPSSCPSRSARP